MSHGMLNETWTEARIAKLKELWLDASMSTAKIAAELGGGISRSAVIGKGFRLGLGPKKSDAPQANKGKRLKHLPEKPKRRGRKHNFGSVWHSYPEVKDEPFVPRAIALPTRALPIEQWTALTCKYIAGDDHLACGHVAAPGRPYCPAHCAIVYTAPKQRTPKQKEHDESFGRRNRTARTMPANKWLAEEAA